MSRWNKKGKVVPEKEAAHPVAGGAEGNQFVGAPDRAETS